MPARKITHSFSLLSLLLCMFLMQPVSAGELKQILYGKSKLTDQKGNPLSVFKTGEGGVIRFEDGTEVSFWIGPSYKKVFTIEEFAGSIQKHNPFKDCRVVHGDPARPYNIQNRRYQTFLFIAKCPAGDLSGIFVNFVPAVKNQALIFYSRHSGETKPLLQFIERLKLHKKPE